MIKHRSCNNAPAALAILIALVLLISGCDQGGPARIAPRGEEMALAPHSIPEVTGALSSADLERIRAQFEASVPVAESTPEPVAVESPIPEPTQSQEKISSCERWSEQVKNRFMYLSFRKVGDNVTGVLYDKDEDNRINIMPGLEQGGLRIVSLNNEAVVIAAASCQVQLARSTTEPVPNAVAKLDQNTMLSCAATIQLFKQIAEVMNKYFENNSVFPSPGQAEGILLPPGNPREPAIGFIPPALVEPGVYLNTLPKDPFTDKGSLPFRYGCIPNSCWIVIGNGPDGDADIDPMLFLTGFIEGGYTGFASRLSGSAELYNPAKGANSNGDIIVWGPGGEPSIKESQFIATSDGPPR